jgi:mannose-1-phosphate guanylyltransferase
MKILIMAGGSGERFWPLSTKERPKQLLPLISDKTMIRETVDRLQGLVKSEDIYVATNAIQMENLKKELPEIPDDNIIIEPAFRDTAAAILYSSTYIANRNINPVIIVLASDHAIENIPEFQKSLKKAYEVAKNCNKIVTLGIKPNYPETGYGYIKVTDNTLLSVNKQVYFYEKPTLEVAKTYVKDGLYMWNSGMFIFKHSSLIEEFKSHSKEHLAIIDSIIYYISRYTGIKLSEMVKDNFESFPKISIDYAIMEKSNNIFCIPTDFGWNDVGTFDSLFLMRQANGSIIKNDRLNSIESFNNLVINQTDASISLVGIENIIVVIVKENILILKKGSSNLLKRIKK